MAEIYLHPSIYIPYGQGREAKLLDPTPGDRILTDNDLASSAAIALGEVVRFGKERIAQRMNDMQRQALKHLPNGQAYLSKTLKPEDFRILASPPEIRGCAAKIISSQEERQTFIDYLRRTDRPDPFAVGILEDLAQGKYTTIAGHIFHHVEDTDKQAQLLSQMQNIGAAARMLLWAEEMTTNPFFYNARCTTWAGADKRLAIIVGTSAGSGLGVNKKYPNRPTHAILAHDRVLRFFVDYYRDGNLRRFWAALEELRRKGEIETYRLSLPHQRMIETVEVRHGRSITERGDEGRGSREFLDLVEDRISDAMTLAETDPIAGDSELRKILHDLESHAHFFRAATLMEEIASRGQNPLSERFYDAAGLYERGGFFMEAARVYEMLQENLKEERFMSSRVFWGELLSHQKEIDRLRARAIE